MQESKSFDSNVAERACQRAWAQQQRRLEVLESIIVGFIASSWAHVIVWAP